MLISPTVRRVRWHDLWPSSNILRAYLLVGLVEAIGDITIGAFLLLLGERARPGCGASGSRAKHVPTYPSYPHSPSSLSPFLLMPTDIVTSPLCLTESLILAKFEFFADVFRKDTPDERTALPVYLAIFVLAHLFQCFMAWEAVYNRNVIQVRKLIACFAQLSHSS